MFILNPEDKDICLIFCHQPKDKLFSFFLFVLGLVPICIILGMQNDELPVCP
jgi:hypothetical protein